MLKNCVFKIDVDTKQWFKSTIIRAIKTFAQVAASMITVGVAATDIKWKLVFSVAFVAQFIQFLRVLVDYQKRQLLILIQKIWKIIHIKK